MLVLIAFVVAVLVAVVVWRAMSAGGAGAAPSAPPRGEAPPRRVSGPDDDPEFLRQLDERVRRPEDPPA